MSGITITVEHWECECGYSQDGIKINDGGLVALGTVIGFSVAALAWWLSSKKE